jgi:hypothetical protein
VYDHFATVLNHPGSRGTLRKIGKFIHGEDFEPDLGNTVTAKDEIGALREREATLKTQLQQADVKNSLLLKENQELREQLKISEPRKQWEASTHQPTAEKKTTRKPVEV